MPAQPLFVPGPDGRERFWLLHEPAAGQAMRGAVLHVHAWAEELNKSRRMVATTGRALAARGWLVLQVDLLGCGDSAGELEEARLDAWLDELTEALDALAARTPGLPLWLWGHRFGALLAGALLARTRLPVHLLLWQPVLQGKAQMQQFLRLIAAAQLADGGGQALLAEARARLDAGEAVDIAGYRLPAALYRALQTLQLQPAPAAADGSAQRHLVWLEQGGGPDAAPSPAAAMARTAWAAQGWTVQVQPSEGPAFWQTVEIEDAPAWTAATVRLLDEAASPARLPAIAPPAAPAPAQPPSPARPAVADTSPARHALASQAIGFAVGGERLVGVLHPAPGRIGVLVIVGGPQYRVGSHRQFVATARACQAAGWPALRFDVRGMGDSSGALQHFEQLDQDIAAAVQAFFDTQPQLEGVVLWGLCDGASAALMYLARHRDARVRGLCLVNPWVRSAQSEAVTRVKHYYLQRLASRDFWRKLLGGQVAAGALGEFLGQLRRARGGSEPAQPAASFQQRMRQGLAAHDGPCLLALSGQDYTAREFIEYTRTAPDWQPLLQRPTLQRLDLPEADHTLSQPAQRRALDDRFLAWLQPLASAGAARRPTPDSAARRAPVA